MTAACWRCKARPAGNDYAGPYSAYCETCQPRESRPQPRGSQCCCRACGRIFATFTDFDRHQETYPRSHDLEGVFTGRCLDPAALGLDLASGVWGTPAGNAKRTAFGEQAAGRAAARKRQSCLSPANSIGSISQVPPAVRTAHSADTVPAGAP